MRTLVYRAFQNWEKSSYFRLWIMIAIQYVVTLLLYFLTRLPTRNQCLQLEHWLIFFILYRCRHNIFGSGLLSRQNKSFEDMILNCRQLKRTFLSFVFFFFQWINYHINWLFKKYLCNYPCTFESLNAYSLNKIKCTPPLPVHGTFNGSVIISCCIRIRWSLIFILKTSWLL